MKFDIGLILSQILAFLIMLWILKKWAWKPIFKILQERKENIQSAFAAIEEQKKELQKLNDVYKAQLTNIEEEAKQKIAEAIEFGRQAAEQIREDAHNQAKKLLQKTRSDLENEIVKAQKELQNKIVDTVFMTSEKFIEGKTDREQDRKWIEVMVEEIK